MIRILESGKRGYPIEIAAALAGVPATDLRAWLVQGRADVDEGVDTQCAILLVAWEQVRASAAARSLDRIMTAGKSPKNWRANVYLLETFHPEVIPDRKRGGIEPPDMSDLTDDEIEDLIRGRQV